MENTPLPLLPIGAFRDIVDQMQDGLYIVDPERLITFWSAGAERITGYCSEEVLGRRCADNILCHVDAQGRSLCADRCPLLATIQDQRLRSDELFLKHRAGHRVPVTVRTSPFRDEGGAVVGGVEVFAPALSLSSDRERIRNLELEASLDALTGLYNRRAAMTLLKRRVASCTSECASLAVLVIDIDHFKRFNDTHGHSGGDRVLRMVARTISGLVEPAGIAARWGGEEFLVLMDKTDPILIDHFAQSIRTMVECGSVQLARSDTSVRVTVSIGWSIHREGDTDETVFDRADRALYRAKAAGRNRVSTFDWPQMGATVVDPDMILSGLSVSA